MKIFSELDWSNWLYGMWVATVTGLSTSATVSFMLYFQKPEEHNPMHSEFWVSAAMIAFMTSGKDFFLYLKQNPAPKIITEVTGTKTVTAPTGEVTTTVVQKTTTVEAPAPNPTTVAAEPPKAQ
jgi:hypothetical protein